MNKNEIRYLCVEANYLKNFLNKMSGNDPKKLTIVPNLTYGLVAVSPILSTLREKGHPIKTFKIGSTESHDNPTIIGANPLSLSEILTNHQPNFAVIDGTRNTGSNRGCGNKYPDAQQGYLNYTIVLNDAITNGNTNQYIDLLKGVSKKHIRKLRRTREYDTEKEKLDSILSSSIELKPYRFEYWNPAGLKLAIYNRGIDCQKEVTPIKENNLKPEAPIICFINSVIPDKELGEYKNKWGIHIPAYFDDRISKEDIQFLFDKRGVYPNVSLNINPEDAYKKIIENGEDI